MKLKTPKEINRFRRVLRESKKLGEQHVFAQLRMHGDEWYPVDTIKVICGIMLVELIGQSGSWMPWDIEVRK